MPLDFARLPIISVIGYMFYNESLTWYILFGSLMVFLGNYINIKSEGKLEKNDRV